MQTAGFVLVGGRSSRMGKDKGLLPWRDQTVVETIAAKVRKAAGSVALVGRRDMPGVSGIECLPDLRPNTGPLAGIETALASRRGELNLIVACDLPMLETGWLKMLLRTARVRGVKCVVARDSTGSVHPLCGVYSVDCLEAVQNALIKGRLKVMEIIQELRAEQVEIPSPIWNVNTPEQWRQCVEIANGR